MFIQFIMICICMLTINMLMNLKIKNNEKKMRKFQLKMLQIYVVCIVRKAVAI